MIPRRIESLRGWCVTALVVLCTLTTGPAHEALLHAPEDTPHAECCCEDLAPEPDLSGPMAHHAHDCDGGSCLLCLLSRVPAPKVTARLAPPTACAALRVRERGGIPSREPTWRDRARAPPAIV